MIVGNVGRCQGFLYWMSYPFVSFLACFQVGGFKHICLYRNILLFFFKALAWGRNDPILTKLHTFQMG